MDVHHHKTLTLDGKTWVYYRASSSSFLPFQVLEEWCAANAKGTVVFGSTDRINAKEHIQPFVFADKDDAMRFKLSF